MLRVLVLSLLAMAYGFVVNTVPRYRVEPMRMGFLDGFKKAFENDPAFEGQKGSEGLSGGMKQPVELTICGKKTKAIPGQRMKDVIRSTRAPVPFNCENGECGTCECLVNGRKIRVCKFNVPAKGPVVVTKT